MNDPITVLVDCDGVMADLVTPYLERLNEKFGLDVTYDEVTSFEFSECVCTKAQNEAVWKDLVSTPGFVLGLRELPYAMEGLAHLRGWADRVVCLTSPMLGGSWIAERCQWLLNRGFAKRDIVIASDKSLVDGHALIDDAPHNLEGWSEASGGFGVAIRAPYNRGWSGAAEDDLLMASVWLQSAFGR